MLKSMTLFRNLTLLAVLVLVGPFASADWVLDNKGSALNFASVKNGTIVEAHLFSELAGRVTTSGAARLEVTLGSIDTMIPIRDERLREILFEIARYPRAVFESDVPAGKFGAMAVGETESYEMKGSLTLHGATSEFIVPVTITRNSASSFSVASQRPLVISALTFGLADGVEALRKIAGLQAITPAVPVSFSLVFVQESSGD